MRHRIAIHRTIDPCAPDPTVLQEAARLLTDGRLIAYPTDTLYGLGADPRIGDALDHLFRAKRRAPTAGIPLIATDAAQVETDVGQLPELGLRLATVFWPGPLTLVIESRGVLDRRLLGGRSSVAVRVPDHAVARGLASALGHPVTASSANLSGTAPATTAVDAIEALGSELDLVLDGGVTGEQPSTIVDVRGALPLLVRAGVVPWERVLQSLL